MAESLMAEADRDLILRALYEEYYRVHPSVRQRSHWVMDARMWDMVRTVGDFTGSYLYVPLPDADLLMSLPVEIRDGAEGVRLEPNE